MKIRGILGHLRTVPVRIIANLKHQFAILAQLGLDGILNHRTIKTLNPFSGEKIRAIHDTGTVISFLNLQRFDPHLIAVTGDAFSNRRFYLFPDVFHRANNSKSLS